MTEITLSPEQAKAVDAFGAWLDNRDKPYFVLEGPPGSGKTTIAKYLAEQHSGPAYFMAYTGAASAVLTRKGMHATTIHSSIYLPANERIEEAEQLERELAAELLKPITDQREKHIRKWRRRLEELYSPEFVMKPKCPFTPDSLIICDEMSMIGEQEAQDLLSFNLPVLVLGDPNQLPPISGKAYFGGKPDYALTEIHRQALDSPILFLASQVLKGKTPTIGKYGTSAVIRRTDITSEIALGVSQIITGSNKARINFNKEIRALKKFEGTFPKKGEKLICLRNNQQLGIFNGQLFEVVEDSDAHDRFLYMNIKGEGFSDEVVVHKECFTDPDVLKSWNFARRKFANEFDYAYACTCHKAQGSQFNSVLVYADQFKWDPKLWKQWLLTALTRAEERVILAL